ncbi:MAG: hypothetical protein HY883_00960 [Deltaproteobacteria bacterium]|nr:hypothetical protein [Deltaproteobacteria bacterium]
MRKKMKKVLILLVALTVAIAYGGMTMAEEAKKAEPAKAAAAPAKAMEPAKTVTEGRGKVTAVDVKAKTITVKTKKGDVTISITDASKIMVGKEAKALTDVKVGDKVKVTAAKKEEKMEEKKEMKI